MELCRDQREDKVELVGSCNFPGYSEPLVITAHRVQQKGICDKDNGQDFYTSVTSLTPMEC